MSYCRLDNIISRALSNVAGVPDNPNGSLINSCDPSGVTKAVFPYHQGAFLSANYPGGGQEYPVS